MANWKFLQRACSRSSPIQPSGNAGIANSSAFSCANMLLRAELEGRLRIRFWDHGGMLLGAAYIAGISGNCSAQESYAAGSSPFYETRKSYASNPIKERSEAHRGISATMTDSMLYAHAQGYVEF